MNLNGLVGSLMGGVNPLIQAGWLISSGYTKTADFKQVPAYEGEQPLMIQVQAMSSTDLQRTDSLNIQGIKRAVYINGQAAGVVRADQQGGDLLLFPMVKGGPRKTWLVTTVLETWPDWVKVMVVMQDDPNS